MEITDLTSRVYIFTYSDIFLSVCPSLAELFSLTEKEFLKKRLADIIDKASYDKLDADVIKLRHADNAFISKSQVNLMLNSADLISADLQLESYANDPIIYGSFSNIKFDKSVISDTVILDQFFYIRRLIYNSIVPIILIDPNTMKIVVSNISATNFYGYKLDKLIGMDLANISTLSKDILDEEIARACNGEKTFFISKHILANSQIKDVNENVSIINIAGKSYLFVIIIDITRRKLLEKQLEEKNRVLVELNSTLSKNLQDAIEATKIREHIFNNQANLIIFGEVVRFITDDWQTPIKNIGLLIQDLEDQSNYHKTANEEFSKSVNDVVSQLNLMDSSLEHLSSIFSLNKKNEDHDIYATIDKTFSVLQWQMNRRSITLNQSCRCDKYVSTDCGAVDKKQCPHNYLSVCCNRNECKQILATLLINSADTIISSRAKGILFADDEGLIFVKITNAEKFMKIEIEDNGGGADEETLLKVFDPYFSTKSGGTGIGLYLTKLAIESMFNGHITFENFSHGVRVTIQIPKQ